LRQLFAIAIITCGIAWYFSRENENIKNKIILQNDDTNDTM